MISTFMAQINSLQTELRQLAHAQNQTHDLVAHRERSLEKERKLKDEIRRKYKVWENLSACRSTADGVFHYLFLCLRLSCKYIVMTGKQLTLYNTMTI